MVISQLWTRYWLLRGMGVMAACLMATFTFPLLARLSSGFLPASVSNLFFFLSQFIFPYDMLVVSGQFPLTKAFHHLVALTLNIVSWGGISLLFAWYFQKNEQPELLILWAVITVFLVTLAMQIIFGILGLEILLEGP